MDLFVLCVRRTCGQFLAVEIFLELIHGGRKRNPCAGRLGKCALQHLPDATKDPAVVEHIDYQKEDGK